MVYLPHGTRCELAFATHSLGVEVSPFTQRLASYEAQALDAKPKLEAGDFPAFALFAF